MWTRFLPLAHRLHELLHIEKRIGKVHRVFVDFGLEKDISTLPLGSRHKDLALGAGSLLDVGVYSLTWGLIILEGGHDEQPEITSKICMQNGIEVATSIILNYPKSMRQGILTSTTLFKTSRDFARIEGSKGSVVLSGNYSSEPESFTVKMTDGEEWVETFEKPGWGFHYEADEVALDIVQGKKENAIMPLSETLRVMKLMDAVRKEGGARYPQDDEYMLGVYPPLDD